MAAKLRDAMRPHLAESDTRVSGSDLVAPHWLHAGDPRLLCLANYQIFGDQQVDVEIDVALGTVAYVLDTAIVPLCCSMTRLTSDRPSPVPRLPFVVKNASQIRSSWSSPIPQPLSRTLRTRFSSLFSALRTIRPSEIFPRLLLTAMASMQLTTRFDRAPPIAFRSSSAARSSCNSGISSASGSSYTGISIPVFLHGKGPNWPAIQIVPIVWIT